MLAGFLLVGGVWSYQKIDDAVRAAVEPAVAAPADRAAVDRLQVAAERVAQAEEAERRALHQMELAREAYRPALDAGEPAGTLELAYEDAQVRYEQAQAGAAAAGAEVAAATPPAEIGQARMKAEERRANRLESLGSFGLRLVLVLFTLAASLALLARLRSQGSRYLPLGLAAGGFAAILAVAMAGDYVTDYSTRWSSARSSSPRSASGSRWSHSSASSATSRSEFLFGASARASARSAASRATAKRIAKGAAARCSASARPALGPAGSARSTAARADRREGCEPRPRFGAGLAQRPTGLPCSSVARSRDPSRSRWRR